MFIYRISETGLTKKISEILYSMNKRNSTFIDKWSSFQLSNK